MNGFMNTKLTVKLTFGPTEFWKYNYTHAGTSAAMELITFSGFVTKETKYSISNFMVTIILFRWNMLNIPRTQILIPSWSQNQMKSEKKANLKNYFEKSYSEDFDIFFFLRKAYFISQKKIIKWDTHTIRLYYIFQDCCSIYGYIMPKRTWTCWHSVEHYSTHTSIRIPTYIDLPNTHHYIKTIYSLESRRIYLCIRR